MKDIVAKLVAQLKVKNVYIVRHHILFNISFGKLFQTGQEHSLSMESQIKYKNQNIFLSNVVFDRFCKEDIG